jgi:alpha-L-rhamnosidase
MKNGVHQQPHWIWLPCQRTLPSTFLLFRRTLHIRKKIISARGWITADSRYRFYVDGQRLQWGPAPCDPRWLELDPLDLTKFLTTGEHVLGAEVLFYGHGDGTWPTGSPGFQFQLTLDYEDGEQATLSSDKDWKVCIDRARSPGAAPRWFLRALQERFDARLHPMGWNKPGYVETSEWIAAQELPGSAQKPAICSGTRNYAFDTSDIAPQEAALLHREIPLLEEQKVSVEALRQSGIIEWHRDPNDWFDFRVPGSCTFAERKVVAASVETDLVAWPLTLIEKQLKEKKGIFLTFEFAEQVVGFPYIEVEAEEGAIIELLVQEAHDLKNGPLNLDTGFYAWSRFTCKQGLNTFECFDYESVKWLQVQLRGPLNHFQIKSLGVRRRLYLWPQRPHFQLEDKPLQRLMEACLNTIKNSAQETCVDGMGRERQQYSADVTHQLQAIRPALGDTKLSKRFIRTFSTGITQEGYFLDCWPAYDRLARLIQRQLGMADWGPILDHGVAFVFDCWRYYEQSADVETIAEVFPRLKRFVAYLESVRLTSGLLAVKDLGVPCVWIDHDAYQKQEHKQCAFNLMVAAMLKNAYAGLAQALGETEAAAQACGIAKSIEEAVIRDFWCLERELFICNLPWTQVEGGQARLCDRSLSLAILYQQNPEGKNQATEEALSNTPQELGLSYPPNSYWRYSALAELGRMEMVLEEFDRKWVTLPSVLANNTIQEYWTAKPDSIDLWSHCGVIPLVILYERMVGVTPLKPGYAEYDVRPQLGKVASLEVTVHTPQGPIEFKAIKQSDGHAVSVTAKTKMPGFFVEESQGTSRRVPLVFGKTQSFFLSAKGKKKELGEKTTSLNPLSVKESQLLTC